MKSTTILSILALTLTIGCATGPLDEDGLSPANTGGTGGQSTGTGGTVTLPADSDVLWAKAGGVDLLLINGRFCKNTTATLVGNCRAEGLDWVPANGSRRVTKNADGYFPVTLTGAVEECHVSLMDCGNDPIVEPKSNKVCGGTWANYGCPTQPSACGTHLGGGYAWCGPDQENTEVGNIGFRRHPGSVPDFFGSNVPNGG